MTIFIIIVVFAALCFFALYKYESRNSMDDVSYIEISPQKENCSNKKVLSILPDSKGEVTMEYLQEMISRWATDYAKNYRVPSRGVVEHEVYTFCGWLACNYLFNNGYISKDLIQDILPFLHEKVNKAGQVSDEEFLRFYTERTLLYNTEIGRLVSSDKSDKPYIMEALYCAFYKCLFVDDDPYEMSVDDEFRQVCEFMDAFVLFWNKVNKELVTKYKPKPEVTAVKEREKYENLAKELGMSVEELHNIKRYIHQMSQMMKGEISSMEVESPSFSNENMEKYMKWKYNHKEHY